MFVSLEQIRSKDVLTLSQYNIISHNFCKSEIIMESDNHFVEHIILRVHVRTDIRRGDWGIAIS